MRGRKTVVFVANRSYGIWSSRELLARRFLEDGWRVIVAASRDDSAVLLEDAGAEFCHIPFAPGGPDPFRDVAAFLALLRLYKVEEPDLIHHFNFKPIFYGGVAARIVGGRRVVSTVTGTGYAFERKLLAPLAMLGYRVGLGVSRLTVFQNPDDQQFFEEKGLVDPVRARLVVSSGVDTQEFRPASNAPPTVTLLMVTRLLWQKGVREYVEAAARLKQAYPHVRFLLGGEEMKHHGDAVPPEWLNALELRGIEYIGYVDNMPSLLQACSGFVFPSKYREGVPRVLLEAAATALPIITTDQPGCREVIRGDENGFLVEVGEVDSLVFSMEQLINSGALRNRMGKAGRRLVQAKFTLQQITDRMMSLYRILGVGI